MSNDRIWGEMEKSYKKNSDLLLPERLLAALEAAEEEGGDIRGKQSAAILVVSPDLYPNYWQGRVVELRVEDNPEPLLELKRLLRLKRAYEWAEKGYDLLGLDRFNESQDAFQKAWNYAPEIEELRYLQGISLLESGRASEAAPILRPIFKKDRRWIQVTKSLKEIGMINSDDATLNSLFS